MENRMKELTANLNKNVVQLNKLKRMLVDADDHTRCPECLDQLYFCDCTARLSEKVLVDLEKYLQLEIALGQYVIKQEPSQYKEGIVDGLNRILRMLERVR